MNKTTFLLLFAFICILSSNFLNAQNLFRKNQKIADVIISTPLPIPYEPQRENQILSYINGPLAILPGSPVTSNNYYYMSGCIDFTAAQMTNYVGGKLFQVKVAIPPQEFISTCMNCKIWIKDSLNGAVRYSQDYPSLTYGAYNDFILNTEQTIIQGKFVIGYTLTIFATSDIIRPFWCSDTDDPYQQGGFNYLMSQLENSFGFGANFLQYNSYGNLGIIGYVRDVTPHDCDLVAMNVTSSAWPKIKELNYPYTLFVKNDGELPQNNYTVQLIDHNENILAAQTITTTLEPKATTNFALYHNAPVSGEIKVRGKVIVAGDEVPENNITAPVTFRIYPMPPMAYCNYGELTEIGDGSAVYSAAICYPTDSMANYAGHKLTAIELGISDNPSLLINCSVWIRNSLSGSNLYSQPFMPTTGWNTIELNTPYLLQNTNTYIGYTVETTDFVYPIGYTENTPIVPNGGHIAFDGVWTTFASLSIPGNVAIIGTVDFNIPVCNPATNLTVTYNSNCNAILSWTDPDNVHNYNIIRDGLPIASNITTTSYTDADFNIFVDHTWSVRVVCQDIMSDPIYESLPACSCYPPSGLDVVYIEDCKALLTWDITKDGREYNIYRDDALIKSNLSANTYTDMGFNTFAEHKWSVRVVCSETNISDPIHKTLPACSCYPPTGFDVNITEDCKALLSWNSLGSDIEFNIYRDNILLESNFMGTSYIDEDFDPTDVHTWIIRTICFGGSESIPESVTRDACIVICNPATSLEVIYTTDCEAVLTWEDADNVNHYNIYRDYNLITSVENTTTYTDTDFDAEMEHKWAVRVVCSDGGLSPSIEKTMDACIVICEPATDLTVEFPIDCFTAELEWKATAPEQLYNIYRNDVLIKTKHEETSFTDTNLDEGKDYIWKVTVFCEPDKESEPVSASKRCVGIHENVKTTFTIIPNPATNNITVTAETNFHTIEILNFLGQTIISQVNNINSVKLDISRLSKGIYFVRIISDYGVSIQKFVKQ
ncbi:MAG: T9SS type A sorting domain-containing protein [Bacteroidales bacterium]|jgi:hypothetical protein|nr:T9SS type A sorting domain-containing protein [Bacteroidales bacterium]